MNGSQPIQDSDRRYVMTVTGEPKWMDAIREKEVMTPVSWLVIPQMLTFIAKNLSKHSISNK